MDFYTFTSNIPMNQEVEEIVWPDSDKEGWEEVRSTERRLVDFKEISKRDLAKFHETYDGDSESVVFEFLQYPVFKTDKYYVLVRDLASYWNYPSSYQLMKRILKQVGRPAKDIFSVTDRELNNVLFEKGMIKSSDLDTRLFYTSFGLLYETLHDMSEAFEPQTGSSGIAAIKSSSGGEDKITVSQVFPQYGLVDSTLELDHASFNSLNSLSKLNYYRSLPNSYRYLPNSKLNYFERELILKNYDVSEVKVANNAPVQEPRRRNPVGRTKKHAINIDPNTIDLTESIIPGQGYIQEFNVNHLCRVPNYYSNNSSQGSSAHGSKKSSTFQGGGLFGESVKVSKNVQQLVYNNDNDGYSLSKYYYNRGYRGPGSGNFKDISVLNKLGKISTSSKEMGPIHKIQKDLKKMSKRRYNQNVKGLVYDKFNKRLVDATLARHKEVEDFNNLEMLHSCLQYNVLMNSYREISEDTWRRYYAFKLTDFEQLSHLKKQPSDILRRFTHPTAYKEIVQSIPVDLRDSSNDLDGDSNSIPSIKDPLHYTSIYNDSQNPSVSNKIDIISFPNANSVGSENFRRFRRTD